MLVHIEISLKPPNSNWGDEVWMAIGKAMMAILCYRRNVNATQLQTPGLVQISEQNCQWHWQLSLQLTSIL